MDGECVSPVLCLVQELSIHEQQHKQVKVWKQKSYLWALTEWLLSWINYWTCLLMLSLDIVYRKSGAETLIVAITLRMPRDSDPLAGPTGDDQGTSNATIIVHCVK